MARITIGELKKLIESLPDDTPVLKEYDGILEDAEAEILDIADLSDRTQQRLSKTTGPCLIIN